MLSLLSEMAFNYVIKIALAYVIIVVCYYRYVKRMRNGNQ